MTRDDRAGAHGRLTETAALAACALACALAFIAFPLNPAVRDSFVVAGLFRGLWCGLVGGLALSSASRVRVGIATAAGAVLGGIVVRLATRSIAVWVLVASLVLAVVVALAVQELSRRIGTRWAASVALVLVAVGLSWQIGLLPGPFAAPQRQFLVGVSQEPVAEHYDFDGKLFLKTMFLVKTGVPYYSAFQRAYVQDSRLTSTPPLKFNYREPWPARFVALLPGNPGIDAWLVFLALVAASGVGAYVLASKFVTSGVALLGSMLLASYFAFPLATKWFPLIEFWAGALAVWVIAALVRERWWLAAAFLTVAVAMRELMIYLIPVMAIGWLLYPQRRKVWLPMAAAIVLPALVLGYHFAVAPGAWGLGAGGGASAWLKGGLKALVAAMRFSDKYIVLGKLMMPALPILALVGAVQASGWWRKALLVSAVVIPTIALAMLGNGVYGYYWGAIVQPIELSMVPLLFIVLLPAVAAKRDTVSA